MLIFCIESKLKKVEEDHIRQEISLESEFSGVYRLYICNVMLHLRDRFFFSYLLTCFSVMILCSVEMNAVVGTN